MNFVERSSGMVELVTVTPEVPGSIPVPSLGKSGWGIQSKTFVRSLAVKCGVAHVAT